MPATDHSKQCPQSLAGHAQRTDSIPKEERPRMKWIQCLTIVIPLPCWRNYATPLPHRIRLRHQVKLFAEGVSLQDIRIFNWHDGKPDQPVMKLSTFLAATLCCYGLSRSNHQVGKTNGGLKIWFLKIIRSPSFVTYFETYKHAPWLFSTGFIYAKPDILFHIACTIL